MKIVLDTEVCKERGVDVDVALYLLSLLSSCKITVNTFEKARQQRLLKFDQMFDIRKPFPEYVNLTETGEHMIESLMANSNITVADKKLDRFEVLADKMRACYPDGYKKGSDSHTKQPWRGNTKTIADRLKKFVMKYGDYTDEEFVDATKRYVADNVNSPYMRILLYFIYKNVEGERQVVNGKLVGDRDKVSPLADYLANKDVEPATIDWDVELR